MRLSDDLRTDSVNGFSTVCACALGYRAADDKHATAKKGCYPAEELSEHRQGIPSGRRTARESANFASRAGLGCFSL
jgi:hypothetical protein